MIRSMPPFARSITAARELVDRPAHTKAQRRRKARDLFKLMRRSNGHHGWESHDFSVSDKARVPRDTAAEMKALDARLARVGMVRIVPRPAKRRKGAHL